MQSHSNCPVCGHTIQPLPLTWSLQIRALIHRGKVIVFTPQQAKIFNMIWKAGAVGISNEAIMERLWSGDRDGGPDHPRNTIHVQISQMKKLLAGSGIEIGSKIGAGAVYRIKVNRR